MSARSWAGRVGLGLAVFAAVLLFWWLTVHARSVAHEEAVAREVHALEERLRVLNATANNQARFEADVASLEAERAALERTLPAVVDQQTLVRALEAAARDLGLVVGSLRWGARGQREFLATAPLTLEVRGSPTALLAFAARVGSADPLLAVRSIELTRGTPSVLRLEAEALALAGGR